LNRDSRFGTNLDNRPFIEPIRQGIEFGLGLDNNGFHGQGLKLVRGVAGAPPRFDQPVKFVLHSVPCRLYRTFADVFSANAQVLHREGGKGLRPPRIQGRGGVEVLMVGAAHGYLSPSSCGSGPSLAKRSDSSILSKYWR
jgi:hypothetical protein